MSAAAAARLGASTRARDVKTLREVALRKPPLRARARARSPPASPKRAASAGTREAARKREARTEVGALAMGSESPRALLLGSSARLTLSGSTPRPCSGTSAAAVALRSPLGVSPKTGRPTHRAVCRLIEAKARSATPIPRSSAPPKRDPGSSSTALRYASPRRAHG